MAPLTVETDRLLLSVETEEHADRVLNLYLNNRDCFEAFEPTRPEGFYTKEFHEHVLRREYNNYLNDQFLRYHMYLIDDPTTIIGSLNFNFRHTEEETFAEVGYKVDHRLWNRGIAYEACCAGFEILREYYDIHRVDARIHEKNGSSLHLAKKLGFHFLVLEPQSANILGKDVDIARYTTTI